MPLGQGFDRQAELLLGELLLRDVAGNLGHPDDHAGRRFDRPDGDRDVDLSAALDGADSLEILDRLIDEQLRDHGRVRVADFRRNDDVDIVADRFRRRVAEETLGRRIPGRDGAVEGLADDRVAGQFDGGREHAPASDIPVQGELERAPLVALLDERGGLVAQLGRHSIPGGRISCHAPSQQKRQDRTDRNGGKPGQQDRHAGAAKGDPAKRGGEQGHADHRGDQLFRRRHWSHPVGHRDRRPISLRLRHQSSCRWATTRLQALVWLARWLPNER